MRPSHRPALRAASQTCQLQRQVAAALALTRLGITFLWQWGHLLILPFRNSAAKGRKSGPTSVDGALVALALTEVQVTAAFRTQTFAVWPTQRLHL